MTLKTMLTKPVGNNNPIISIEGICILELWGHIGYNKTWKHWCLRGPWQGKRLYLTQIPTQSGSLITCKSKELAQLLQQEVSREMQNGTFNPARYRKTKPLQLMNYSQTWLRLKKPEISEATWSDYESSLRLHILPVIGNKYIPDINLDDLKGLLNSIRRDPKGKKNVMGCLRTLMNDAHDSGYIVQMPVFPKFKGKNKVVNPNIEYLEPDQQEEILSHIPDGDRPIFQFMVLTGCRPSEARALRKKDIRNNEIIFAKAFGKKGELKEVKGKKVLPWPITTELKDLFDSMPGNLTPWVFPNPKTNRPYSKNINRIWNRACKEVGIKISLNNGTRHSFATQMLNAGVPEGVVSRLLRHSDIRMIKRYGEYQVGALKSRLENVRDIGR